MHHASSIIISFVAEAKQAGKSVLGYLVRHLTNIRVICWSV